MSERDAFGPSLRRIRLQRGITLDRLAVDTKVGIELWSALERNDLTRWPAGIYARSYVRAYAIHVGLDPEATVDDFCRFFPQGDRRVERVVREQAALVGHDLQWTADLVESVEEDRRQDSPASTAWGPPLAFTQTSRLVAAVTDTIVVVLAASTLAMFAGMSVAITLALCAVAYHAVSLVALGCTPAVWALDAYLAHRHPSAVRRAAQRFLRFPRGSESHSLKASSRPEA
jgi:transcriptional regulator with XRE-family HTH domain